MGNKGKGRQYADADANMIISDRTLRDIDKQGHLTGASYEFLDQDTVRVTWNDLGEDDSEEKYFAIDS